MKVVVWNENLHEKVHPIVTQNFPGGIHGYIKSFLECDDIEVTTAYRNENIQKIIKNAVRWACPIKKNIEITCPDLKPLEKY